MDGSVKTVGWALLLVAILALTAMAQSPGIASLSRTVGGTDSTFGIGDDAGTDSMVYIFPRISAQSYPVVWGNIGIYFKVTTVSGDTDSLSVWFKTKRRLTNSTFVNCANDSFIVFDELDWTSGAYYCWPDQDSNPILFGPCDGIVIYWRYTDTGASDDSCRVVPFVTGQ